MSKEKCPGFKFSGIACGIKKNNEKDLGLIYSEIPAAVAGIFTKNKVIAAPVILDKKRIRSGKCQAVIVNSGNANCCTGEKGIKDAELTTQLMASELKIDKDLVLVSSTGVIGKCMNMEVVKNAIPELRNSLKENGLIEFATAIMTTDTLPKIVQKTIEFKGKEFNICATAKGAGMIRPDMATMLCYICTDLKASKEDLYTALKHSADISFNRITIDGDTSTNDTVLIMANGKSGLSLDDKDLFKIFQDNLDDLLLILAKKIVSDGEGVTKLATIIIKNAKNKDDAKKVAETISHSNLVKTALFGEDANWGRIIGAVGRSGVNIDPDKIDIYFDDICMVKNSMSCGDEAEKMATQVMKKDEFKIVVNLNMGSERFKMYTCDFSYDYVKINADYRT